MQDDLQRAYQAYQQALYYLRNPKVSIRRFSSQLNYLFFFPRTIQNYGTVLVSCTTDTVPWTMPRKARPMDEHLSQDGEGQTEA